MARTRQERRVRLEPYRSEPDGPVRVLVAEADPNALTVSAGLLRMLGYEVREVRDGTSLGRMLHQAFEVEETPWMPDLIVSDVHLPGMEGLELLSWLRQRDWNVRVILTDGKSDPETREQALQLGAVTVLPKPVELEDLCNSVVEAISPE